MTTLREAGQQALAFTMRDFATVRDFEAARAVLHDDLNAALEQPDPGSVCARCGGWVCDPVIPQPKRADHSVDANKMVQHIPVEESDAEFQQQVEDTMCKHLVIKPPQQKPAMTITKDGAKLKVNLGEGVLALPDGEHALYIAPPAATRAQRG